jgi:hypothetical protein
VLTQPGPNRIEEDVPNRLVEVPLVLDRLRVVPVLEQVTGRPYFLLNHCAYVPVTRPIARPRSATVAMTTVWTWFGIKQYAFRSHSGRTSLRRWMTFCASVEARKIDCFRLPRAVT